MRRAALLALALVGCGSVDTGSAARRDAANAIHCPSAAVEMEQIGEYRYRGRGCGRDVVVACSASTLELYCFVERVRDAEGSTTDTPPDVEATIRAGLLARRDDVLACVGRDRIGVRVVYEGDGEVTFMLQGDLADSPEEACVRDALDGVRVAATGQEGVIIHLVH